MPQETKCSVKANIIKIEMNDGCYLEENESNKKEEKK